MPEVSLVAILDADKEGFLRSHRSLTQTAGRAARNINGRVIMYADTITESMRLTIEETERRRAKQLKYNEEHGITPQQIVKAVKTSLPGGKDETEKKEGTTRRKSSAASIYQLPADNQVVFAADPIIQQMSPEQLQKTIAHTRSLMEQAAKDLDFLQAAQYRDELLKLEALL